MRAFLEALIVMIKSLSSSMNHRVQHAVAANSNRKSYVDVFRGLLIAHMALDHASLMFNAGRSEEELAATAAPHFENFWQFLTRFTGVPVAPGFFFMAGFMIALTSIAREGRGVAHADVTRRLLMRGLVLILVDAFIMGLPRAAMGFYSFMVLTSIGFAVIAVALVRDWPTKFLLPLALGILVLHPLIDVSALPMVFRASLYEPVREGAFRSMYPIIPWSAIVLLGFVVGRDALTRVNRERFWAALAAMSFAIFLAVRVVGPNIFDGYGNAYEYSSVFSVDFWLFAKYPPDLPFLAWSFACVFLTLALLSRITRAGLPAALRPLEIFGRVPFFFYVIHFYALGLAQALLGQKVGLVETYLIWIALLILMIWPCRWYYRKKLERPNLVTRYF
jgi:uncharacterized membrane protein